MKQAKVLPEAERKRLLAVTGTSAFGGIAPWKAHEVRWSEMAASVKLSQQPRTESCVVPGTEVCP
jgi:hypothetical protein